MGQVVNIGELETLEANNKPTAKLDFELRDDTQIYVPTFFVKSKRMQLLLRFSLIYCLV